MKTPRAKILVVEDDPNLLKGLLDFLVFNGFDAMGVEDGGQGLETALNGAFDLVLLDVMLPTMDGFSICREIRKNKPSQPVIMLTAKGSEDDIVTGFQAGADDYVSKPFSLRELMVRVQAVLRRAGKSLAGEKIQWKTITFDSQNLTAFSDKRTVEFTRREMDIVFYLYQNQDRIVSKQDLLGAVWNYSDTSVETRTVDIHILKLRKKLNVLAPDASLIQTVRGEGYRLEP